MASRCIKQTSYRQTAWKTQFCLWFSPSSSTTENFNYTPSRILHSFLHRSRELCLWNEWIFWIVFQQNIIEHQHPWKTSVASLGPPKWGYHHSPLVPRLRPTQWLVGTRRTTFFAQQLLQWRRVDPCEDSSAQVMMDWNLCESQQVDLSPKVCGLFVRNCPIDGFHDRHWANEQPQMQYYITPSNFAYMAYILFKKAAFLSLKNIRSSDDRERFVTKACGKPASTNHIYLTKLK